MRGKGELAGKTEALRGSMDQIKATNINTIVCTNNGMGSQLEKRERARERGGGVEGRERMENL